MHRILIWPDIRPDIWLFSVTGIRPNIRQVKSVTGIRPDTKYQKGRLSGWISGAFLVSNNILKKLNPGITIQKTEF
jgi:hypothetical protein